MTMKAGSPRSSNASTSTSTSPSPKINEGSYHRYLKPGALAKLRDSKITASYRHRRHLSLSQLLFTQEQSSSSSSSSTHTQQPPLNQDNGFPCFASRTNLHRPRCIHRKKLFAVTPFFTETET